MRVSLVIASGKKASLSVKIKPGVSLIGRDGCCQVRPKTSSVGQRHCAIICTEDDVWIEDLNSDNGTLLNRVPISNRVRVKDGDRIRTGKVKYTFIVRENVSSWAQVAKNSAELSAVASNTHIEEPENSISPEPFDEMDLGALLIELDEADRAERIRNIREENIRREIEHQEELSKETWFDEEDTPAEEPSDSQVKKPKKKLIQETTKNAAAKGLRQIVTGVVEDEEEEIPIRRPQRKPRTSVPGKEALEDSEAVRNPNDKKKTKQLRKAEKAAIKAEKSAAKAARKKRKTDSSGGRFFDLQDASTRDVLGIAAITLIVVAGGYYAYHSLTYDPAVRHALFKE